jgi:two-component system, OmpR family, response regulator
MDQMTGNATRPVPYIYDDGCLRIEHDSFYVSFNSRTLFLPPKEFLILSSLSCTIGRMEPSEVLWRHVWGDEEAFNSGALRVHICNLRKKIIPMGMNIRSVAKTGYCLYWMSQELTGP